ncbi:MAG: hypothetical protein A2341_02850 [Deltaproteobacteria bacterium RIFOXYB12_FULL_58_9]|nr:MAG: hypothetical protein A2341_02850 [Deltaproteobacteria bacterium RIFOXYB12_FULL_58_9]
MQATSITHPAVVLIASLALLLGGVADARPLDEAINQVVDANLAAAKSQRKVNDLDDAANELLNDYRATIQEFDSLTLYNQQLQTLVASQQAEIDSLREQIDNVSTIGREITPLMTRMLDALEQFVGLDVPFLLEERTGRVAKLRAIMERADVTNAEKYRRILEAYQIENDYGRTIETYKSEHTGNGGSARTVNFLRIGRVALIYQTLDEAEAGVWDRTTREWIVLPNTYRSSLRKGFRIASKQAAPDLLRIPVSAPRSVP